MPTQAFDTRQRGQSTSQRSSSRPDFTDCRQASITGSDSDLPVAGERQRADMPEIDLLALQHQIGDAPREAMAVGGRFDRRHQPFGARLVLGRSLRRLVFVGRFAPAGGELGRLLHQLAVAALDGREKAGGQQQPAEQIRRRRIDLVFDAASRMPSGAMVSVAQSRLSGPRVK